MAAADALSAQQQILSIPRRFSQFVRDVWGLQRRLEDRYAPDLERLARRLGERAARWRAAHGRIERAARKRLDMVLPEPAQVVVVRP